MDRSGQKRGVGLHSVRLPSESLPTGRPIRFEVLMLPDEGNPFNRWMINDQAWPKIDALRGKAGRRYRIAFHDGIQDSHPLHLHRHNFELISVGGKPTAGIVKDTVNVPRNSAVEVDALANNPGPSLLHCHMQQHMDYGFKMLLEYL
jgi:FtsP/CotA-like multicopper oxidase with cupredoxin domain